MQPASGSKWLRIIGTAAGTTVVSDRECVLQRVVIPSQKTGTISFYDSATGAGTTSANEIFVLPNTAGTIPVSLSMGFKARNGLVAVVGGTTDMTITIE